MFDIYRVYDVRTDETLFTSKYKSVCVRFIDENYDERSEAWDYVFIESVKWLIPYWEYSRKF